MPRVIMHLPDISCSMTLSYTSAGQLSNLAYLKEYDNPHISRGARVHIAYPQSVDSAPRLLFEETERQFSEYFAGQRRQFDLPLVLQGTPFQMKVWRELQNIPYGTHLSYSDLAQVVGNPRAVRAVASGIAANRFPIIIPCHRVVHKSGAREYYAIRTLGHRGEQVKRFLIKMEKGN